MKGRGASTLKNACRGRNTTNNRGHFAAHISNTEVWGTEDLSVRAGMYLGSRSASFPRHLRLWL